MRAVPALPFIRRRLRITLVLALTIGGLVLASTATALLLEWMLARKLTIEFLNDRVLFTMDAIERGIHVHLDPAREAIDDLAELLADGQIDANDPKALTGALLAALAARPELSGVVFITPELEQLTAVRDPNGNLTLATKTRIDDPAALARLHEMRDRRKAFWGDVLYVPTLRQSIINVRRAVYQDDALLGYLAAAVTVGELSSLVNQLGQGGNETAFILYGKDRVLAHPRLIGTQPEGAKDVPLESIDAVADKVLANLPAAEPVELFNKAGKRGMEVRRVAAGAEGSSIILTRTIHDYGAVPWTIGVWFPASRLEQATQPLREGAMAGFLVLVVAIAATVVIGRRIARPIHDVTERASQISSLDTSEVEPLPPSRILEIDEQSRAFNAMLATLQAFETYVPRSLVRRLIRSGRPDAIASRQRDLTVMFTDIVGFTRLSERLPPEAVAQLLNQHFTQVAHAVEAEGGTVDKFIGDGLMAFWGAPEKLKNRTARACRAALAIRAAIEAGNKERATGGLQPIRMRIGLHRGPIVVGNIGAPDRINYTVVGDAVNVAQRLEQLGKAIGSSEEVVILLSDAVAQDLEGRFALAPVGELEVRGRNEPVQAFSLLGTIEAASPVSATTELLPEPE